MSERYQIQEKLKQVGSQGQEKIKHASVAIIGLGGLGSPCSLYLAAAGVGKLLLVDGDEVAMTNLHRQILYKEKDIGLSKAKTAFEKLHRLNAEIEIQWKDSYLEPQTLDRYLKEYQYVVDCTDQIEIRLWMNHYCLSKQKFYVYGSCDQWSGQAALFVPTGPCLVCLFPEIESGLFQDCQTQGVLGPTVGIIGLLQAQLVLNHILFQEGENILHLYHGRRMSWEKIRLQKNRACVACQQKKMPSFLDVKADKISFDTLAEWRKKNIPFQLVDLRPPFSYVKILEGEEIDLDPKLPIVLVCHQNRKSPLARIALKQKGYQQVYILDQGNVC